MEKSTTKRAAVFGGGWNDQTTPEYKDTVEIGRLLAEAGYVVKTGGYRGMMEAASKGAFEAGGHTVGHTCRSFGSVKGNEFLTETVPSEDLFDRLRCLIMNTDLFVIQKGGTGTLAELFLTLDILRKVKENRPKILLIGQPWESIVLLGGGGDCMIPEHELEMLTVVKSIKEFKTHI